MNTKRHSPSTDSSHEAGALPMTAQHAVQDLLEHFQHLISTQSNLPSAFPPTATTTSPTPLPQHPIPSLPAASSTLSSPPLSIPDLSTYLSTHILPHLNASSLSPNYYGFVTGGVTPAALLADWLVSLYDQNVQVHLPLETISTAVEVAALNQLLDLMRLPKQAWGVGCTGCGGGGTFTTGATASNVLGLALGREWVVGQHAAAKRLRDGGGGEDRDVSVGEMGLLEAMHRAGLRSLKVLSTLPHSSIAKAASVVGIGRSQVISVIKEGTDLDIDLDAVQRYASEPRTACILVLSAGEVNTGRFATTSHGQDRAAPHEIPWWRRLRDLCDQHNIWVHVDGAFGLFARALLPAADINQEPFTAAANVTTHKIRNADEDYTPLTTAVTGLENLADSITGDAHKLLNVPYDCGFFFTRHKHLSEKVFVNGGAAYLTGGGGGGTSLGGNIHNKAGQGWEVGDEIKSPLNIGLENSRRFRALPVHATLMAYGREGYVDLLKRQIGLARRIVRWLWSQPGFVVLPGGDDGGDYHNDSKDGKDKVAAAAAEDEAVRNTFIIVLFRARDERVNEQLVKRINADGRMYVSGTKWRGKSAARIAVGSWMVDVERDGEVVEGVLGRVVGGW